MPTKPPHPVEALKHEPCGPYRELVHGKRVDAEISGSLRKEAARLFAASPEMRDALELLLPELEAAVAGARETLAGIRTEAAVRAVAKHHDKWRMLRDLVKAVLEKGR